MGFVAAVVVFNVVVTAVGYALLGAAFRGRSLRTVASYSGVALLVGTSVVGICLVALACFGAKIGLVAFAATAVVLAAAGLAAARLLPARLRESVAVRPVGAPWAKSLGGDLVATVSAAAIVAILVLAVIGGFRAAPWLDDTWFFWLPKGIAIDKLGLVPELFSPTGRHMFFTAGYHVPIYFDRPDNPLLWSILLNQVVRLTGSIDLRAVDGELAFLVVGFAGAVTRLLWGRIRPAVLLPGLLLILSAPEFLRQAQGGDADIPLGIYLSLALLAAVGWLAARERFALVLTAVFAAAAIGLKAEGLPELLVYLAILSAFALSFGLRRLVPVWGAAAVAVATSLPWFAWRAAHGVHGVFSFRSLFDPSYLGGRGYWLRLGARTLFDHLTSPREWSIVVPVAVAVSLVATLRERRSVWLTPLLLVALGYGLLVWVIWADPKAYNRVFTSSYRYVTPLVLIAAISIPIVAERLVRTYLASRHPRLQ